MKNNLLFLFILFANLSCTKTENKDDSKNNNEDLKVSLQWEVDNDFKFNEVYYTVFPVYTSKKAYPRIYEQKLKEFKNIPEIDSFLLVSSPMQRFSSVYRKYINGYGGKEYLFNTFKNQLNDTLLFFKEKNFKDEFNAISSFFNNKQIVIADLNNNSDFSDDQKLVFSKNFHNQTGNNTSVLDTLPLLDFSYQLVNNGEVYNIKRKIIIYPNAKHRYIYLLSKDLNESLNSYTLMMELKDYAKGTITLDSINYTIAVQGKEPWLSDIVIKPDSIFYPSHNLLIQSFFSHKKGDTVSLAHEWYKIEGVSPEFKRIEFTKVTSAPKFIKRGIQFGKRLNDQLISDLDGSEINLFSEMNDKKFMLLDFWGTWCGPCKELTPKLIAMHKKYNDNVSFVSIAYDKDANDVKSYIKKNNIDWFQGFVNRKNKKNTIVDRWEIKSFPTFFLINSEQQILYMGSGGLVLEEIDEIIKSKF